MIAQVSKLRDIHTRIRNMVSDIRVPCKKCGREYQTIETLQIAKLVIQIIEEEVNHEEETSSNTREP